jgi:hypothetical protein
MYNLLLIIMINTASADNNIDTTTKPNIIYKESTEIDFEAIDIEGKILKPNETLIQERNGANFSPLINIRHSFLYEINNSLSDIK